MFYTPPTHEEPIRSEVRPLNFYRITWALSIVRDGASWRAVRSPAVIQTETAGLIHGTDYFIGGHEYDISEALVDELTTAGFPTGLIPPFTYGSGRYGGWGFGGVLDD